MSGRNSSLYPFGRAPMWLANATGSLAIIVATMGGPVTVSAGEEGAKYIRIERDKDTTPIALQTPVIKFVPRIDSTGVQVDLIGAVHVGEKSYYDQLNKLFDEYDLVLYELVAPESNRIPQKNQQSSGMISAIQRGMKTTLRLEFQLDHIDYTKKNFVHADMSPQQFSQSMEQRGESFFTMFMDAMRAQMSQQMKGKKTISEMEIIFALFNSDQGLSLKRIMATQFEDLDSAMSAFGGEKGSTIITERNKVALAVLKQQIDQKKGKKIGIFYGAGHFPDMEKRLESEFGLKRSGELWLTAWNMATPVKPAVKPATKPATSVPAAKLSTAATQ